MSGRRAPWIALATIIMALGLSFNASTARAEPTPGPTYVCHFDVTCPEVPVAGDPPATVGGAPAPFRGYGDPSIERDAATGTIWLTYSWLDTLVDSAGPPPVLNRGVQTHLARSDDGGATFTFVRAANVASQLTHPDTSIPGWAIHEVSSLLDVDASSWQMLWLTYFAAYGDFPPSPADSHTDFYLEKTTATSPSSLGDTSAPWIDGSATSPSFGAQYDLSTIPQLSDCVAFTEPALFRRNTVTYLATNCVVFVGGVRRPDLERLVLLQEGASGYTYVGALLTYADAQYAGASRMEQADISLSRSGAILLIVSPIQESNPQHLGCIVYQITDPGSASVLRDGSGHAVPLATITGDSTDSTIGGGQCTYDEASSTGVIMVMHQVSTEIVYSMHATGVQPDVPSSIGGVAAEPRASVTRTASHKSGSWWLPPLAAATVAAAVVVVAVVRRRRSERGR